MPTGHAERLFPIISELLATAGLHWGEIDAVAVCSGPGNFTGIRIGVAAARGLALARGIPAIGVTRFEALAWEAGEPALVALDGRDGRLLIQHVPHGAPCLARIETLPALPEGLLCLGHRAGEIAAAIAGRAGSEITLADPSAVAHMAACRLGRSVERPAPLYLRAADAAPPAEPAPVFLDDT
jgi:tRNA threonylcarbamoyl adenosine modification protein YeaZ